ncbi:type II secretion system F family protein [Candidatus Pacearchaeota archaeon]|nr:type II secretion system F family protein [Candidatus Pacearchaeota archaeon]
MIEELKRNVNTEIGMLREISIYVKRYDYASENERKLLLGAIQSLKASLKILNNSIPELLKEVSLGQKLPSLPSSKTAQKEGKFEKIHYKKLDSQVTVVLNRRDRDNFLKELSISEQFVRKLRKRKSAKEEKYEEFKVSRGYLKLANKIFLATADKLVKKGYFKTFSVGLKKANMDILFESYIAMMFFSALASFIIFIPITVLLIFIDLSFSPPFLSIYAGSYLLRIAKIFWIPIAMPIIVFSAIYIYPSTEKKSIGKRIEQELPFAVIHMSSISGSGIAPTEIFKIIGLNREYPYLRKEIRKVLNQINLYGYDLVTSLNNAAKTAPSEKLAELFSGLSTAITSGASLSDFLEKRAETLLLNYRLEREKYTKLVETFLDIYISLVIAAPMIFLLLFIMMAISGIAVGFTSAQLTILSVFTIAILNFVFILFLQFKQPAY